MELDDLKLLWTRYDTKLGETLRINMDLLRELNLTKVKSNLKYIFYSKLFEAIVIILCVWYFSPILYNSRTELQIVLPLGLLISFWIISLIVVIKQMFLILSVDYSKSVAVIQKRLTLIKLSIIQYVRISFLSFPLWFALTLVAVKIFLGDMIQEKSPDSFWALFNSWWFILTSICTICIPAGIWIYKKFTYKNLNNWMVRFFFKSSGGKQLTESMKFLEEINEFEKK